MAVCGLHNVSMLDSSFLGDSQSPISMKWSNQDKSSGSASYLLQMWRELECDHVMSHPQAEIEERPRTSNGSSTDLTSYCSSDRQGSDGGDSFDIANAVENGHTVFSQVQMGSQIDDEDSNSFKSDFATDLGEDERKRVRQIFQEWMNKSIRSHAADSHISRCSREQWLGKYEQERVRIVREWVQKTSQQRGDTCGGHRQKQSAELGSQNGQDHNGSSVNYCEIGAQRPIPRLCGRQALLDFLMRTERERKRELQCLQDHRPVSGFAQRNRIKSLLRGRFLRNAKMMQNERLTLAECELGLLRQRHTVAGLREEFLSRLGNFIHGPVSGAQSDAPSNDNMNGYKYEYAQENCQHGVLDENHDQAEPIHRERSTSVFNMVKSKGGSRDVSSLVSTSRVEEAMEQVMENEEREQHPSSSAGSRASHWLGNVDWEQHQFSIVEFVGERDDSGHYVNGNLQGSIANERSREYLSAEGTAQGHMLEVPEVFYEHVIACSVASDVHAMAGHVDAIEDYTIEDFGWQETSDGLEEQHASFIENEESIEQPLESLEFDTLMDSTGEESSGNRPESKSVSTAYQWSEETSSNVGEDSHQRESHGEWHENQLQEYLDGWMDGHSRREASPVGRVDSFYFPDDDNEYSEELRELLRRRCVSNLLQSGFRESLDQLIQSYIERQAHASVDWELERVEQEQELQIGVQNAVQSNDDGRNPLVLPAQSVPLAEPLWNQDSNDVGWPYHNIGQQLGIDWEEIITDLRVDMAQLQQRMDNMQTILATCMDIQLELQRAVRQEVSAALNRSAGSADAWDNSSQKDEFRWDHVRKGVCCICYGSNIECLLYSCGHMCTCLQCAEKLLQSRGKCPMCWTPVINTIRCYSIQ